MPTRGQRLAKATRRAAATPARWAARTIRPYRAAALAAALAVGRTACAARLAPSVLSRAARASRPYPSPQRRGLDCDRAARSHRRCRRHRCRPRRRAAPRHLPRRRARRSRHPPMTRANWVRRSNGPPPPPLARPSAALAHASHRGADQHRRHALRYPPRPCRRGCAGRCGWSRAARPPHFVAPLLLTAAAGSRSAGIQRLPRRPRLPHQRQNTPPRPSFPQSSPRAPAVASAQSRVGARRHPSHHSTPARRAPGRRAAPAGARSAGHAAPKRACRPSSAPRASRCATASSGRHR